MIKGKPISLAMRKASARSETGFSVPGRVGTPTFCANVRAVVLSPIIRSSFGRGPTKVMPASSQAWAKSAFSERKP